MATYIYKAKDENGNVFDGIYEDITSISRLREEINKIGYSLISAKKQKNISSKKVKIKQSEIVEFAFKFAGMSSAGLSIPQCLDTLEQQTENDSFRYIISDVRKNIEAGLSLTDSFAKHRDIFSYFFLGMVEAGESSGKLSESLEISAKYLEKQAELRNKLKSAFSYPIILGIMCIVIVAILVIFIVPVFSKIYRQLGVALPGPTQFLVLLSLIAQRYWPALLGICVSIPFLVRKIRKSNYIKMKWDFFKFKIPIFGRLNRMVAVSNFIRSFAMLLSTGVPIIKSIQVATMVADNWQIAEISEQVQKSIQAGVSVTKSLEEHSIFPPIIVQLAMSGEQAGVLSKMLNKGVDFLEKDIERSINKLLVKLEPILTLTLGSIIGTILLAVYLPMFDYMAHLK